MPEPQVQDVDGLVVISPEPDACGDAGTVYLGGGADRNCYVNWQDLAILAGQWLEAPYPDP